MTNSFLPNVLLCKWCATSTASTPLGLTRPVDPCAGRSPLYAVACPIRRQRQRRGVLYLHFVSNAPSGSMPPANCDCDTQRVGGRIFRRRRIHLPPLLDDRPTAAASQPSTVLVNNLIAQKQIGQNVSGLERFFAASRSLSKALRVPQR